MLCSHQYRTSFMFDASDRELNLQLPSSPFLNPLFSTPPHPPGKKNEAETLVWTVSVRMVISYHYTPYQEHQMSNPLRTVGFSLFIIFWNRFRDWYLPVLLLSVHVRTSSSHYLHRLLVLACMCALAVPFPQPDKLWEKYGSFTIITFE